MVSQANHPDAKIIVWYRAKSRNRQNEVKGTRFGFVVQELPSPGKGFLPVTT